ncbi:Ig-like domain-containing protein, partial [Ralstonia pseudosolanacearum]
GTTTADASGNWTFTPTTSLADGSRSLTATTTDTAGNVSTASTAFTLTVDTDAPPTPVITTVTDNVAPVTGAVTAGGSTNDATPTLTGTAEAHNMISIFDGATLIGATVADASGNWTFTPIQPLADGNHSLTATATDPAGNVGTASSAFTLTVDTAAPAAPVISTVTDNVAPVTGAITAGGSTNDAMPVLTGTAEANSTVSILDG